MGSFRLQTACKVESLYTYENDVDESEHVPTIKERKENEGEPVLVRLPISTSPSKLPANSC